MCQGLVDKVARSEQLRAVTDPDILVLFEEWLDELEAELAELIRKEGDVDPVAAGRSLGLSERGALFMVSKMRREGKIKKQGG